MGVAVVPIVTKMVVGFAVGKLVGEITGNELLGAVAGGLAGGGLGFSPGGGFTWSMDNIASGFTSASESGAALMTEMPGGTDILSGADLANSSLFQAGLDGTGVDLFAGGNLADAGSLIGETVVNNTGGGISNAFTFNADPGANMGTDLLGGNDAATAAQANGGSDFDLFGGNTSTPAAPAGSTTPTAPAGSSEGTGISWLDKSMDFINKNEGVTKILADGVSSMLSPDEAEIYAEEKAIDGRFQMMPGDIRTPRTSMVDQFADSRARSPISGQSRFAPKVSPNYQKVLDRIKGRQGAVA